MFFSWWRRVNPKGSLWSDALAQDEVLERSPRSLGGCEPLNYHQYHWH